MGLTFVGRIYASEAQRDFFAVEFYIIGVAIARARAN